MTLKMKKVTWGQKEDKKNSNKKFTGNGDFTEEHPPHTWTKYFLGAMLWVRVQMAQLVQGEYEKQRECDKRKGGLLNK